MCLEHKEEHEQTKYINTLIVKTTNRAWENNQVNHRLRNRVKIPSTHLIMHGPNKENFKFNFAGAARSQFYNPMTGCPWGERCSANEQLS